MNRKRWMLAVLLLGLVGCSHNKTRVAYNGDAWRVVPVVSPGETFELSGLTIVWDNGDSPCVEGSTPCEIRKGLTGRLYGYSCREMVDCDPEIAVDDPGGIVKALAALPSAPPTHVVKIACVAGTTKIDDTTVRIGDTIGWGAFGSGVQDGWKVHIDMLSDLCTETADPIQTGMVCTVKAQGAASFPYTVSDACGSQQSTPPSIKVIEM